MLRLAASLAGAVLLLAVAAAAAAADVFNGRIAFTSYRDGGEPDIFTMTPAGTDLRQLTVNDRNDHQPDWHPSGTALAYRAEVSRRFQVWRMRADGRDQVPIVVLTPPREASQPSWFPDRTGLLLRRSGRGPGDGFAGAVFRAGPGGENPQQFFSFSGRQWYPSWSPQMTKVLIAMTMSEPRDRDRGIFTVDPATLQPTPLFDLPGVFDSAPAWAPDGSRIAFESDGDPLGLNPERDREIFVMNADGTGVTQLTRNEGLWDEGPAWAPDGEQLAYTSGSDNTHGDINVMTAGGVHLARLTDFEGADESPDWQTIPAADTDRRCGDAGAAVDVRAAGQGMPCAKATRLAERWSERSMPSEIRRFDALVADFGGTLRVELVRRHGHDKEQLVTFLHPRPD
jgi:Tol biopolymer transport system component